jgi:predicted DNA-binding transcriptional regulator AlpA
MSPRNAPSQSEIDPLQLIDKQGVADLLSLNPATVDRMRKSNPDFPQPFWITDKTPRWHRKDIQNYIASRQQGGISPDWTKHRTGTPRKSSRRGRS